MTAQVAINLNLGSNFGGFRAGAIENRSTGVSTAVLQGPGGINLQDKVGLNFTSTLSAGVTALGMLRDTALSLNNVFKGWVDRFGRFSPQVAQVQAQEQVKDILRDIRIAREQGPELAQFARSQAELTRAIDDIQRNLLKPLLPIVSESARHLARFSETIGPAIQKTLDGVGAAQTTAANNTASLLIQIAKMTGYTNELKDFALWWTQQKRLEKIESIPIDDFLDPNQADRFLGHTREKPPAAQEDWVPAG